MPFPHRPVYRHADLRRLLNPSSIAVHGVSPNPASFGAKGFNNLKRFSGKTWRVNPKYPEIDGDKCYPSIRSLPEPPDCVLIALPRPAVEEAVLECAEAGVGGVVIFASGYLETGKADRIEQQHRLTKIARDTGIRIIGPNCMGFGNFIRNAVVSFAKSEFKRLGGEAPGIGVVSQSGAMGFGLAQGMMRGINMSHVITMGNSCDVNVNDAISFLADDPDCRAIACLFEGMTDAEQLMQAGEVARRADKPVLMCKIGNSDEGASAALSHTGSLAGSEAAYRAAAERAGIIMLDNLEYLLEMAAFFAKVPRQPKARGVIVNSSSGGAGIISADVATRHGVALPQPPADVSAKLATLIPEFVKPKNPLDVTAMVSGSLEATRGVMETIAGCTDYGIIIYPVVSTNSGVVERFPMLSEIARKHQVPLCQPLLGGWVGGPGQTESALDPWIIPFGSLDCCFASIAAWHRRADRREAEERDGPRKLVRLSPANAKDKAAALITAAKHQTLTEREAKDVLALYGVPVVGETLVQSAADAVSAAQALGLPVVMKVESPDIPHKTEAGVIRLNLKTAEEVTGAYDAVMANAKRYKADAKINGVLVQPMVPAGTEIMVGGKVDPLFGPLIVAGLGGVLVELLQDTALALAPVTKTEAQAMLARLKGQAMLRGFRGAEPVDQDPLAEVIVRLAEFLDDQQAFIAELDVNPLICSGKRIIAVDALMIRKA